MPHVLTGGSKQANSCVNGNHDFRVQNYSEVESGDTMNLQEAVYIVSAARTPVGSLCGSFTSVPAHQLGAVAIKEALKRANVEGEDVDELIFGHVLTANEGQNPARQAGVAAGLPLTVPAYCINMLCGSGLKSVVLGYHSILVGDSKIVVAGGQENMTRGPHATFLRVQDRKIGNFEMVDLTIKDGLTDAFNNGHMGQTAENVAKDYDVSREEQDKFAESSQRRYAEAKKSNFYLNEIAPVPVSTRGGVILIEDDEYPKPDTNVEKLAKLKPAFQTKDGTVTAGNASGINDGAAAVILMAKSEAEKRRIQPLAKIIAWAQVGIEPRVMGMGPVEAIRKAVEKAKWTLEEVDLFEINEAFASLSVAVVNELGIDENKVNVNGGSIAIGHPIGASGTRVLVTLLYSLKSKGLKKGVASLCIGGGMGIAMCVESI